MPHKNDVQVALISGGTSGIGFATLSYYCKKVGASLSMAAMNKRDKEQR